jgi:XTP/dITP diphosphohydrolase
VTTLLLATRNAHKAGEIRAILGEGFAWLTLNDFPEAPQVTEDAPTFAGNATKKAVALAGWLGAGAPSSTLQAQGSRVFVLADDSGLEVDALAGAPGVHSARFAAMDLGKAGNSPDAANNAKLLRLLQDVLPDKRTGRFRCVLALAEVAPPGRCGPPHLFEGTCEGRIGFAPRGQGGFGYDPLFVPDGYEQTFAELGEAVKNTLSHRARALRQLRAYLALEQVEAPENAGSP